jgi:hypothetical protein
LKPRLTSAQTTSRASAWFESGNLSSNMDG